MIHDKHEYITVKVADLIPYAMNARTHSESQVAKIAASIREFGFNNPVLIDKDKVIIAGHGRVLAAQKLGLETVPCLVLAHLDDARRRAYILADNRLALDAGWDDAMLRAEVESLMKMDFDVRLAGFEEDEIKDLMGRAPEAEMPSLPTDTPTLSQMTFTLSTFQANTIKEALEIATNMGAFDTTENQNSNGNALARVCEFFMKHYDES